MKFELHYDRGDIAGAFEEEVTDIEVRTTSDPLKNPYIGQKWYEEGENHRTIVNAHPHQPRNKPWIARDVRRVHRFVEVESLDALMALVEKHGDVFIHESSSNHTRYSLEFDHECE